MLDIGVLGQGEVVAVERFYLGLLGRDHKFANVLVGAKQLANIGVPVLVLEFFFKLFVMPPEFFKLVAHGIGNGASGHQKALELVFAEAAVFRRSEIIPALDLLVELFIVLHKGNRDRKSTRLNSSHVATSYAVFCV